MPVGFLLAGLGVASTLQFRSIPLAVLLIGLGLALGGGGGRAIAPLALGLLGGWLDGGTMGEPLDLERPVTLVGRLAGHWRSESEGWQVAIRGERLRQGPRVDAWRRTVLVSLPGTEPPPAGFRLRFRGYLRRSPPAANGTAARVGPWRLRIKSRRFVSREPGGWIEPLILPSQALRRRVEAWYESTPKWGLGVRIARALVLGDASEVPPRARQGLRRSGLAHLLALSGLHVGLLAATVLLATTGLPRALRLAAAGSATVLYVLLAGPRPSLLRAAFMAFGAACALLLRRPPSLINLLGVLAGAMALAQPSLLRDLGFILTVSATGGILVLAPLLFQRWTAVPWILRRPLAVTVGAQLATLPWTVSSFHMLNPLAPFWNLTFVPWTALVLLVSLVWTGLGVLAPAMAINFVPIINFVAKPYSMMGELGPGVVTPVLVNLGPGAALGLASIITWALLRFNRRRLFVLGMVILGYFASAGPSEGPQLAVIDVGQGEAILLQDGGTALLVDGGGWRHSDIGGRVLLPVLAAAGIRRLRALVLSHPDLDHCAGLLDVASYLRIGEVWTAPGWWGSPCAMELLTLPGVGHRFLWAGEKAAAGRWRLQAVHPAAGDRRGTNNRSLVLMAEAHGRRILLTGDLEAAGEARLLARGSIPEITCDILKLAHHGSKSSTTAAFLDAVRPRLALVSAGPRNHYGHPSEQVLSRLSERHIRVLRTDRDGLIRVVIRADGSLRITTPGAPRDQPGL